MLELFILNEQQLPVPNPEILTISVFRQLVERDKSKVKDISVKELAYIFWESNYQSPFRNYDIDKIRLDSIKKDVNLDEEWNPDDLVLQGVSKYKELQQTPSMEFLEAAEIGLKQLRNYIRDTKLDAKVESGSKKGDLLNDPKKYGDMFTSMPQKVKAYQEMKNLVDAEVMQKATSKGGRELGMFAKG
jgi:hypothetical protein